MSAPSARNRREKEVTIWQENIKQLKRLQSMKASFNVMRFKKDERDRQKLMRNVMKQPYPIGMQQSVSSTRSQKKRLTSRNRDS